MYNGVMKKTRQDIGGPAVPCTKGRENMFKSLEVKKGIHWVGVHDPNLRIFDIIMYTPYGTSYNSFVVSGEEKTAVFETAKVQFLDEYLERLTDLGIDYTKIDYIIVSHTEPDHSGSVARMLELAPNAVVCGSQAAIGFLKEMVNKPFNARIVKENETIDLGGKTIRFISAPFLHWPDSIYSYIPEDKTLITCDSFGLHYDFEPMFDDLMTPEDQVKYDESLKSYFDIIFGPYKPHVLKAIDKIRDLDIDTVLTGHGPILRKDPWSVINRFAEWAQPEDRSGRKKKVTVSYVSAYGYTKEIAEKIIEGIRSAGDFDIVPYDVIHHDMADIVKDIADSDGILFGSPTIVGELLEPIRILLAHLNPVIHGGKLAGGFGSYGWSGEAVPRIETRLGELKMKLHAPGLKVRFKASEDDLKEAFNWGKEFGEKLQGTVPMDKAYVTLKETSMVR